MKNEKISITDIFEDLKRTATSFGAASTSFKTEDNEWEYIVSVKRKKYK